MFSLKPIVPEFSRSFGVIVDKNNDVVETLYHTEYLRDVEVDYKKELETFITSMKKYCSTTSGDEYHLKPGYKYEMACHANVTKGFQRFIKIYYGASGWEDFQPRQANPAIPAGFPKNSVIYASSTT
jgi:hypothetical protein